MRLPGLFDFLKRFIINKHIQGDTAPSNSFFRFLKRLNGNKDRERKDSMEWNTGALAITAKPEADKEETMANADTKKHYLYIALTEEGRVILGRNGEPFFQSAEEGTSPDWPNSIYEYANKVIIDEELRVELPDVPANLSNKDKDRRKKKICNHAESELSKKAKERIEAAKKEWSQLAKSSKENPGTDCNADVAVPNAKEDGISENAKHPDITEKGNPEHSQETGQEAGSLEPAPEHKESKPVSEHSQETGQDTESALEHKMPEPGPGHSQKTKQEAASAPERKRPEQEPGHSQETGPEAASAPEHKQPEPKQEHSQETIQEAKSTASVQEQKKPEQGTDEKTASILAAIKETEAQVNNGLKYAVKDLTGTMDKKSAENTNAMKSYMDSQEKRVIESSMRYANEAAKMVSQKTQTCSETSIRKINEASKETSRAQAETIIRKMNEANKETNRAQTDNIIRKMTEVSKETSKAQAETIIKKINETSRETSKAQADNIIKNVNKANREFNGKQAENILKSINKASNEISEKQDMLISKAKTVGKRMDDLEESLGGMEGKLSTLEQLDKITDLLGSKGLSMHMEIPPVNADEEDIINLVRYSQKITEQLGYAARELLRKQEAFKNQEQNNANEQKVMEQKLAKAREDGIAEGQRAFVSQLIAKYADVDTIRESENPHVHVIWALLMELGVSIDGEGYYEKGREIEFTEADIAKMIATYSKLDGAGKYKVIKTGLCFQGEILSKAVFERTMETKEA